MESLKNVLIFGGNGLVGKSFLTLFEKLNNYTIFQTARNPASNQIKCDITDFESIKNCFKIAQPDIVINCTNLAGGVNFCENNPELSEQFHFEANKSINDLSIVFNSIFVLISTDYVFDGKNQPYIETDGTNPLNAYGIHKLKAENHIINSNSKSIIARTTNVFGWDPDSKTPNFLMQLLHQLKDDKKSKVPSFLSGNPTFVDDLTNAIFQLIKLNSFGIFHIVGQSNIDRFSWAKKFCSVFNLDSDLLEEIKTPSMDMIPRPLNSNLNTDKLKNQLGFYLSNVDEGLVKLKKHSNGE